MKWPWDRWREKKERKARRELQYETLFGICEAFDHLPPRQVYARCSSSSWRWLSHDNSYLNNYYSHLGKMITPWFELYWEREESIPYLTFHVGPYEPDPSPYEALMRTLKEHSREVTKTKDFIQGDFAPGGVSSEVTKTEFRTESSLDITHARPSGLRPYGRSYFQGTTISKAIPRPLPR